MRSISSQILQVFHRLLPHTVVAINCIQIVAEVDNCDNTIQLLFIFVDLVIEL